MTEQGFRLWAESFPDALMLVTRAGRIVACNSAVPALFMVAADQLTQQTVFDFAPSEAAEAVRGALRLWSGSGQLVYAPVAFASAATGKLRFEGSVLRAADQEPRRLLVRVKRHEAATAKFVTLTDKIDQLSGEIRLRRQSEQEVRRQREWFHVTLASIGDAVIATDVEGRVVFMNAAAEALTGWTLPEVHGTPMQSIFQIHREHAGTPVENPVDRVLREGRVVALANHTLLRSRQGVDRPIEDSAAPIRDADGKLIGVVLVFRDVSDKKQAQAALLASERRFRLWTELNVIAAGVADLVGRFLEGNDALLDLLGCTRAELLAGECSWRGMTPPEFLERDRRAIEEARERGACHPYEKEYVRKDGRRVPVIIGYAVFRDPGRYEHQQSEELAICYIVDISDRKRAEETLEKRVEERTAQLQAALADLETFSYTISHDLRTPLRAMQGYAQYVLSDFAAQLPENGKDFLRRIVRSGDRLDALIRDVLAYAQVSKGNTPLGPVELQPLVTEVLERMPVVNGKRARVEIAGELAAVKGNAALLTQCLANLIGNAVKFVPKDRTPQVTIGAESRGGCVRIWVQDNGIGIPPEELGRVFGIFERGQAAGKFEGTGIGLSIVRRAAEKMGGAVGVESDLGHGSRFWIELEAASPAA